MTVPRLPTEIIQDIFKRLNQEDRWNTLYLYKKWYLSVKSIYFESVFWQTEEKVQRLKQHLTEVNKNSNGAHVFQQLTMTKRLCISDDYGRFDTKFTAKEFLYLLSRFPNLRQLDIPDSEHLQYYMKILCECPTNELPQLLEDIVMKGYYFDEEDEDAITQKFKTCYRFRQTLKRLTLANLGVDQGNRFIRLLPDFKSLKSLEIRNDTKPHLTLFHLLRACPSLSSIKYTSTFEVPRKTDQQLADWIYDLDWQDSTIAKSLNNLKKVELSIPKLTIPYIEFFTHYSPKSLDEVSINFTQIGMHEWIEDVTLDVALNLCRRLQKLKSVKVEFRGERGRDHGEINIFYEIWNTLTGEKEFQTCSVFHSINNGEGPSYVPPASIEINGSKLSYSYGYKIDKDKIFSLPTFSPSGLQQLQKITSLSIWMENERNTFPDMLHFYLEYVKRYMPKLSFFSIRCSDGGCSRHYSKGVFTARSPLGRHSLENMTNISVHNIKLSDSVMTDLSTYFPRTEVLTYDLCATFKERHEIAKLDVSNLKYLNTLDIPLDITGYQHPGPIFITFLDKSRHKVYYLPEYRWRRKETVDYRFEPGSLDAMREGIESDKCSYSIDIKGSDQLRQINFSNCYMSIDLIKTNLVIE